MIRTDPEGGAWPRPCSGSRRRRPRRPRWPRHNEAMFRQMQEVARRLRRPRSPQIREIFAGLRGWMGQGNPAVTRHPLTPEQAAGQAAGSVAQVQLATATREYERICGEPYMAPLYDPATQAPAKTPRSASTCSNTPTCRWPTRSIWVRANEAAQLCAAEGKRMGDAHEWEGAAAGALLRARLPRSTRHPRHGRCAPSTQCASGASRYANTWTYGPQWRSGICATGSFKNPPAATAAA